MNRKHTFTRLRIALLLVAAVTLLAGSVAARQSAPQKMVLFVVTSHHTKGATGEPTGYYLSEVSHPWNELIAAGYEVDFVSPLGGNAPVDGLDLSDPINSKFWNDPVYHHKITHTMKPADVHAANYAAIHYAGGHGTMWDFAGNAALATIAARIYEQGGIVSAVCHGPAGLVNVKLSGGNYLVAGKEVSAFTNEEEAAVNLDKVVPYLLESKLIQHGAHFRKAAPWQPHVVTDGRLITGQNPQSATAVGEAVVAALQQQQVVVVMSQYHTKDVMQQQFGQSLQRYAATALNAPGNIMAQVYAEQDSAATFWVIERWASAVAYRAMHQHPAATSLAILVTRALARPAQVIFLTDLEYMPPAQWHRAPAPADTPLTIVLFVEARPGTQQRFQDIYHVAMPQFRSEPGVINYQLSRFRDDPTRFVTYEHFRSEDAFQCHLRFPPIQPVISYLNSSIRRQPFQLGLHRLRAILPDATAAAVHHKQ